MAYLSIQTYAFLYWKPQREINIKTKIHLYHITHMNPDTYRQETDMDYISPQYNRQQVLKLFIKGEKSKR